MMPLWTTQTRPSSEKWGWALASVGAPCVAQRVWAMPVTAAASNAGATVALTFSVKRATLPTARTELRRPLGSCKAKPAES